MFIKLNKWINMINVSTLSGDKKNYQFEWNYYKDILKYVRDKKYPEFGNEKMPYVVYVQNDIKLFHKGLELILDDEINFKNLTTIHFIQCNKMYLFSEML